MFTRARGVALTAMLASFPSLADDPPADAPREAEAPPPEAPPPEAPPDDEMSPAELKALEDAMAADAKSKGVASSLPDLSQVNLGAALPQSMNPDISMVLDTAAAWFSVDDPLQAGGHDPSRAGFTLQAVEMSIGASADPYFRFDSNIVFTPDEVELEEAYATTLALPANLQLRAGQFLTRFGRINSTHPHAWHFVDQPIVIGKFFGGEGNRGIGGELSYLLPVPWFTEAVFAVNNADGDCCARSYLGDSGRAISSVQDLLATFALKQFFPITDDLSLMVGASAQTGPNASGPFNRTEIYGGDVVLRYRPVATDSRWSLSFETEALFRKRQVPAAFLYDGGGYTQIVWAINPEWETGVRYELVTGLDSDPLDPDWTDLRQRAEAQVTYYPSHFSRLRLQGSVDDPAWERPGLPTFAVMASLEVLVGAHGSHSY